MVYFHLVNNYSQFFSQFTVITIPILFIIYIATQRQLQHNQLDKQNSWDNEYDYIVVGAGSAGCVVAVRLTENPNIKVLLIEAGGPQTIESDMPGRQQYLLATKLNWNYPSVSQKYAQFAFKNNALTVARGKAFGGSSSINQMYWYPGNPKIYDLWDYNYGAKGWSHKDVLPYFLRSQNRSHGPVYVSTNKPDIMLRRFITAAKSMGYTIDNNDDQNQYGFTLFKINTYNGIRQSSSVAYLEPNVCRKNLHILGQTKATKILFDSRKKANGIQFYRNGKFYTVRALNEVILSAGVIETPKLLMLSGIGPKQHLKQFHIPVISNLRVGDSYRGTVSLELNFDIKNQSEIQAPKLNLMNTFNYFYNGNGPLAYVGCGLLCFNSSLDYIPDVPIGCLRPRVMFMGDNLDDIVSNYKLKDEWKRYYKPYLNRAYFILEATLQLSKSIGTLRLSSTNPFDHPIIDPKIFHNQFDLDILVDTIKSALKIYQSDYFRQYAQLYNNSIPGCDYCDGDDKMCDTYLRCVARTIVVADAPLGSCKMGSITDQTAVVDERLRVIGVNGLRVIDSSVMPTSVIGANFVTIMIGEKGAQMINDDYIKK